MDALFLLLASYGIGPSELKIILWLVVFVCFLAYIIPRAIFYFYEKNKNPVTHDILREIIYYLDEFADDMSNKEKKEAAIAKFSETINVKGVKIPKVVVGWIVDAEVHHIRYLQENCSKESNLHK